MALGVLSGCVTASAPASRYSDAAASTVGDVYRSTGPSVGTIIFVHGGGFTSGARTDIYTYGGPILAQTRRGWGILSIDYRLDAFPAAVTDVADAVRFVRSSRGAELGLSAERIVVAGHSAGAAIALDFVLAQNEGDVPPFGALPAVDGWISTSGLLDFDAPASLDADREWRTGGNRAASPLGHLDAGDPPGFLVHGTRDRVVPVTHALNFIARSRAVGSDVTFRLFDDRTSCSGHASLCEATRPVLDRFLDRIVSPGR